MRHLASCVRNTKGRFLYCAIIISWCEEGKIKGFLNSKAFLNNVLIQIKSRFLFFPLKIANLINWHKLQN